MQKVLIISHDKVGPSMAGPGIRYHQIATELSKHFSVTLATFSPAYLVGLKDTAYVFKDIQVHYYQETFDDFDVIFALWLSEEMISYAKSKGIRLVFDLYAPVPVEDLVGRVHAKNTSEVSDYDYSVSLQNYRSFFTEGDFFVCSNPIQKDFWVGYAFSSGAVLPSLYSDFSIYDRVGQLPMGINLSELKKNKLAPDLLRKEFPSIKKSDFVIVWTGGIWDWFDAVTPIQAIKSLTEKGIKDVKFVFLGTKHPNSDIPEMQETVNAYKLASDLGIKDSYVFFREGWIDFNSRFSYLLHSNVALYAHKPSVEARYSHRTRVLDHFLCSLPTISTAGDYLGDYAANKKMGLAVEPLNVSTLTEAILILKNNKKVYNEMKNNIVANQQEFTWEYTTKELVSFIKNKDLKSRKSTVKPRIVQVSNKNRYLKKIIPRPIKEKIKRYLSK